MRLIGTLPDEAHAVRLSDYLIAQAMPNHIEQGGDGTWQIWIEKDDDLEKAQAEYIAFRSAPGDERYDSASTLARRIKREQEAKAEQRRKQFVNVRSQFAPKSMNAPVTMVLIVVTMVLGLAAQLNMVRADQPLPALTNMLAFQPTTVANGLEEQAKLSGLNAMFSSVFGGEVWRLVTPIFIHFGPMHIMFNLYMLYVVGSVLESYRGSVVFALLVLGSAAFSNVLQAVWTVYSPLDSSRFSLFGGMSGVNYALFGYAWMLGRYRPYLGIRLSQQFVGMSLAWLVICMTGIVGSVANAAHVGGLIAGCVAGAWPRLKRAIAGGSTRE